MTSELVTHSTTEPESRFNSLRSVLGEWKQLFDGCNFIKRKDRSRSRRKDVKEPKSKRMHSTSAVPHRIGKKSQSTELCVCDSIDDKMIEKFTSLPYGIDQQEWLAAHTLSLFDHVNALCGSISELCTPVTCPSMNFPGTSKAYHTDEKGKRHLYSAMQYMDCVMSFCEQSSRNEDIFPTKYGNTFSEEFEPHIRRVVRLLWHCCGHLYIKHWDELGQLELRPQFSLVLAHMTTLSKTFNLLDEKDQRVIEDTVVAVRPPLMHGALLSDEGGGASSQPRYTRVPSSKSGSWGGHPTPAVLSCKPYAQTC